MPTNEERREVARELREYARREGAECLVYCEDFGETVLNLFTVKCGESFRANYEYLAGLVEPEPERTCRLIKRIEYLEDDAFGEVEEIRCECSVCKTANREDARYCDHCGARIEGVGNDD